MSFLKVILKGKGEGPHDMQFFSDTNEEKLSNLLFRNYFWVTFLKFHCSSNLFFWFKELPWTRCWMYGIDINLKSPGMIHFIGFGHLKLDVKSLSLSPELLMLVC